MPETYASELVQVGGKVLVDERDPWPGKKFATTVLAVSTEFLKTHSQPSRSFLKANLMP